MQKEKGHTIGTSLLTIGPYNMLFRALKVTTYSLTLLPLRDE